MPLVKIRNLDSSMSLNLKIQREVSHRSRQELLQKNIDLSDPITRTAMASLGFLYGDLLLKPKDNFAKLNDLDLSETMRERRYR